MATANEIVAKAKSYIGTTENPSGSNNVIFNTDYYGRQVSGDAYAWCCAFVWDVFRMCNASSLFYNGQKTAYCPAVEDWGRKAGQTVNVANIRAGDIVLFDWNGNKVADHIGIATGTISGGTFPTVEGNVSDAVRAMTRQPSQVCCVIRPEYSQPNNNADLLNRIRKLISDARSIIKELEAN